MKALAIFRDTNWWLKPGFSHVLVAVEVYKGTVVILDPSGGGIHLWAGGSELNDVAKHYRDIESTVVECEASPGGSIYPTRWTCVEVVKRILGIRGRFILTPYQLYRRLTNVQR